MESGSAAKPRRRRVRLALGGLAAVAAVFWCVRAEEAPPAKKIAAPAVSHTPAPARRLYVDPDGEADAQVRQWTALGLTGDAHAIARIAGEPVATWITAGPAPVAQQVDTVLTRAAAANRIPVLVAYNIPQRDCGSFSAGGASSARSYELWIRAFATGIKNRPVIVIVEPDALAHTIDGCAASRTAQRYALLRDAVTVLKATGPATAVYLDAGNPGWITNTERLAAGLRRAGVAQANGFALNVANFITTTENVRYGDKVAARLGGHTGFVIDTSRNGAGPVRTTTIDNGPSWCNPPGRKLGPAPTTTTGKPHLDALLWIKNPGESDGACRPGEPPAGRWWPQYALSLADDS